ncbi:YggS family pyridoxal phosphate-dependent enzyme [Treponema sp.]|uniref:YggS family pyridoxal phosphate-dependent enzyme n=1 Tax=Treponema sp. TaxID=166 RepID=UPI00259AD2DA|nr:YggS family pyridoxal phosphate-dependent enzyme [uncultured Treponema sp.]
MTKQQIADNFSKIREDIKNAELNSGRAPGSVKLCAVSKFHPLESVVDALECHQTLFGENRVQEAFEKFNSIRSLPQVIDGTLLQPQLHIIGSLQLNKVKKAVQIASCIQSVDREELLSEIEKQCSKLDKKINVFFELHTAEDSKSGYGSEDELIESVQKIADGDFSHIVPAGLMTMAPFTEDKILIGKSFERLRLLKEKLASLFPALNINELSMGMSGDYKIAIEEGSTMVRIGTALFGEREYSA